MGFFTRAEKPPMLRAFRFGWYGDNGLGEVLLQKILSGEKTATACPAYDPVEAAAGETLRLVDKSGKTYGHVRITRVENLLWKDLDQELATRIGFKLDEVRQAASFANSRQLKDNEEIRVTHFELISA